MAARFHIIDGYNLLYAAGLGKTDYAAGELFRARTQLLKRLLEQMSPAEIERTTVVFDAQEPPPGRSDRVNVGGITVLFAREGGIADDLIIELVRTHSAPKQVTVVSSDHRVQRGIRGRRGEAVDSGAFLDRLGGRARASQPKSPPSATAAKPSPPALPKATPSDSTPQPKAAAPADSEMEHWLNVFGQVPTTGEVSDDELPPPAPVAPKTTPKPSRSSQKRVPPRSGPKPPSANTAALPQPDDLTAWENVFGEVAADDASITKLLPTGRPRNTPLPGEETELGRRRPLPPPPATRGQSEPRRSESRRKPTVPEPPPVNTDTRDQAVDVDYWMSQFGPIDTRDEGPRQ